MEGMTVNSPSRIALSTIAEMAAFCGWRGRIVEEDHECLLTGRAYISDLWNGNRRGSLTPQKSDIRNALSNRIDPFFPRERAAAPSGGCFRWGFKGQRVARFVWGCASICAG